MDRIPEIMDGKNVADYVDQDIDAKLALLEQEEDQLQVYTLTQRLLRVACIFGVGAAAVLQKVFVARPMLLRTAL